MYVRESVCSFVTLLVLIQLIQFIQLIQLIQLIQNKIKESNQIKETYSNDW